MAENNKIYITRDGLEKIKQELEQLINVERKKIARRIQEAKELGDLSENAEYSSAKEDQAFLEMKIAELENTIKLAEVIDTSGQPTGIINVGSRVKFSDENGKVKEYVIVGSREADPSQGRISNESPIGRAFLGKKKGEIVEFNAPKGIVKFKILEIN
jgi:transcription elongation factor GreA